jgi:hypothetical protein
MSGIRGVKGLQVAHRTILTGSADLYRKSIVADTSGGQTDTYTKIATLPCNYVPSQYTPRERESAVRVQDYIYWDFTFPAGVDIRATDRLYIGSRRFEVAGGGEPSIGIFTSIICLEIK